jgi:hypothetical protein
MKRYVYVTVLWFAWASFAEVAAQVIPYTPPPSRYTIIDEWLRPEPGKGSVVVDQPATLRNIIGARQLGTEIETTAEGLSFMKIQGFRVQVFSGNDQRTSKDEAFRREKEIKDLIPGIPTYVTYNAPFWRLRVGDFNSHEEAFPVQRQLMQAFPRYGKEMYIVKEEIRLPLDGAF